MLRKKKERQQKKNDLTKTTNQNKNFPKTVMHFKVRKRKLRKIELKSHAI